MALHALEQSVAFERELQRLYAQPSLSDDLNKLRLSQKNRLGDFEDPRTAVCACQTAFVRVHVCIYYPTSVTRGSHPKRDLSFWQ